MANMHRQWGKIAVAALVAIIAIAGGVWAVQWLSPGGKERRPQQEYPGSSHLPGSTARTL